MTTGVVIGAGGGIGSAAARALAGSCEAMVLAGRRRERLESVAAAIGGETLVVPADITTADGRNAVAEAVIGEIAWLVLASGLPVRRPLATLSEAEIELAFGANLVGPALLVRRLLDVPWRERAAIAVIGSISASRALPNRAAYGASKAGLEHLARSLAAELAPAGIRVNVVAPGVIDTPFLGEAGAALDEWVSAHVPLGHLGTPDDVANAVRYVVLDAPDYLTGARIAVDGGAEAIA